MSTLYYYTARNADGSAVRGSLEAVSDSAALASLRTRALFITSLEQNNTARGRYAGVLQLGPVPLGASVAFYRAFATLVTAGVPLRRALQVTIEECANARLREALQSVLCGVENGMALSDSMSRRPREFPKLAVAMIKAGELGGVLDEVLERTAAAIERDRALRKRIASALTYPAIVATAALALVTFLLTTVVPSFRSLYEQMHVPIPWITRALLSAGNVFSGPALWIAALCAAAGFALIGTPRGRDFADRVAGRVPIVGRIRRKAVLARIARMLGMLIQAGVGLAPAIEVVAQAVSAKVYAASLMDLRRALSEGSSIAAPLSAGGLYDPTFVHLVRVGEETGALDSMLLRIAEYYDLDVETALNSLSAALEPAMVLLLGGAVGFIVAAVLVPLYTLIGSIK